MDEIFDRIKSNLRNSKLGHKHLVGALIATEILGILTFVWILRVPLHEKFLTVKPKAYSLAQMDSQKRYLLVQNDYLTDYTDPNNKIILLIWENNQMHQRTKIKPDVEGRWTYQLSSELEPGVKVLTVGELDNNNKLLSAQNYRIRIKSRDLLNLSKIENRKDLFNNISTTSEELLKTAEDLTIPEISGISLNIENLSQPQEELAR